ncbi:MAG TPA: hypothetical protein DEP35_10865 [Deltaproteobacteria bacterium]|nr:hypothetical protein [Deltaproteobacteria bacterium]
MLGMAIFLATELMFFTALVSALLVLRAGAVDWPPEGQPRLPIAATGVNTAFLLLSAIAFERGARQQHDHRALSRGLAGAFALGSLFVLLQGVEWVRLIGFGLTAHSSLYGAMFYVIVGAHATHVLVALAAVGFALRCARRGHLAGWAELAPYRMYWFFVVGIWPPLYGLVYWA